MPPMAWFVRVCRVSFQDFFLHRSKRVFAGGFAKTRFFVLVFWGEVVVFCW